MLRIVKLWNQIRQTNLSRERYGITRKSFRDFDLKGGELSVELQQFYQFKEKQKAFLQENIDDFNRCGEILTEEEVSVSDRIACRRRAERLASNIISLKYECRTLEMEFDEEINRAYGEQLASYDNYAIREGKFIVGIRNELHVVDEESPAEASDSDCTVDLWEWAKRRPRTWSA